MAGEKGSSHVWQESPLVKHEPQYYIPKPSLYAHPSNLLQYLDQRTKCGKTPDYGVFVVGRLETYVNNVNRLEVLLSYMWAVSRAHDALLTIWIATYHIHPTLSIAFGI